MEQEIKNQLVVTVLGDSFNESCHQGGGGPRRSSEETTKITRFYLERQFGDAVKVEYHDTTRAEVREKFAAVIDLAQAQRWRYPLVLLDGRPTIAGSAEYYQIASAVAQTLQVGRVTKAKAPVPG